MQKPLARRKDGCRFLPTRPGRLGELGAATVEWLALSAAIAAILAAVYVALPAAGLADTISQLMQGAATGAGYDVGHPSSATAGATVPQPVLDGAPTGVQRVTGQIGFGGGSPGGGGGGGSWGPPTSGTEMEVKWHEYEINTNRVTIVDPRTGDWISGEQITISDPDYELGLREYQALVSNDQAFIYAEGEQGWVKPRLVDVDAKGKIYSYDFETFERALLSPQAQGELLGADASIQLDLVSTEVGGNVDIALDKNGLQAEIAGKMGVYLARVRGEIGSKKVLAEGYSVGAKLKGEAFVGEEAEGKATMKIGKDGVRAGLGGEAFIGGKAEAAGELSGEIAGIEATMKGKAGVSYGLGAAFDLDIGFHEGKIMFNHEAGLTVGVGVNYGVSTEVDLAAAASKIADAGQAAVGYAVKGWSDVFGLQINYEILFASDLNLGGRLYVSIAVQPTDLCPDSGVPAPGLHRMLIHV